MSYYERYYILGYMIRLAIETGMRAAELCALHWEDIKDDNIWIHRQLLKKTKPLRFYEVLWTKNEKKHEGKGRLFPRSDKINQILSELKEVQNSLGIKSDYVFCHQDGSWITTRHYQSALETVCKAIGLPKTNNHAIRMYLNIYVFIPLGIPVTDRARLLVHTVETNLKYYSFESHAYADDACALLNTLAVPQLYPENVVDFPTTSKRKAPKSTILRLS